MIDQELMKRAEKAAFAYRDVYGVFPDKIGIHISIWRRWKLSKNLRVPSLVPPLPIVKWYTLDDLPVQPTISIHTISFEPVQGRDIAGDEVFIHEVYLPVPGEEQACQSCEHVMQMAEEKKR